MSEDNGTRIARVILEHAAQISGQQDISALVGLHAALARDLLGGDRSSVWLIDEARNELWTRVADGINELRIPLNTGIVGASVTKNETIIANDLTNDPRFNRQVDRSSGYRTESVVCIPLWASGKIIGALQVLNKPGGFSAQDAELLRLMAVYAASAIQTERLRHEAETARLLQHELDIAREVQMKMLPRTFPPVPGIDYFGFCRSARFVGGDYFDLMPLGNGAFAFTLGDVSGKGVPAAVMMASIHTLLRSLLMRDSEDLARLVGELNQAVHLSSSADRYTTLLCGVINPERNRLRYVNAGHVPPFVVRSNGTLHFPLGGDIPVGMLKTSNYRELHIDLAPGDLVVIVSDGITEVKNNQLEFWEESNVQRILQEHRDSPLNEISSALVAAADAWADGAEQHDDMTLVAVRLQAA